jgi:hypothetical protein
MTETVLLMMTVVVEGEEVARWRGGWMMQAKRVDATE